MKKIIFLLFSVTLIFATPVQASEGENVPLKDILGQSFVLDSYTKMDLHYIWQVTMETGEPVALLVPLEVPVYGGLSEIGLSRSPNSYWKLSELKTLDMYLGKEFSVGIDYYTRVFAIVMLNVEITDADQNVFEIVAKFTDVNFDPDSEGTYGLDVCRSATTFLVHQYQGNVYSSSQDLVYLVLGHQEVIEMVSTYCPQYVDSDLPWGNYYDWFGIMYSWYFDVDAESVVVDGAYDRGYFTVYSEVSLEEEFSLIGTWFAEERSDLYIGGMHFSDYPDGAIYYIENPPCFPTDFRLCSYEPSLPLVTKLAPYVYIFSYEHIQVGFLREIPGFLITLNPDLVVE